MKHCLLLTRIVALLLLAGLPAGLRAQRQIAINTLHSSLVFTIDSSQKLYQSYFGRRISPATAGVLSSVPAAESYLTGGGNNLFEPAIRMIHADGNPSLALVVESFITEQTPDNKDRKSVV